MQAADVMKADAGLVRRAIVIVLLLVALRLVIAANTPLAYDEAYYWLWSQSLAGGYFDHPPAVAFVIRAGTMLAGDSEFGVRLVSVLLALPMTWAVYRTAAILFASERVGAHAAIFLNATLMVGAGTVIVPPDAPLMTASAFLLYFLAKVIERGHGAWWLAVGAAAGVALLSKLSAIMFGAAILLWLVLVPDLRRWLLTPWPYLGGPVALAIFSPVVLWDAKYGWAAFIDRFGRVPVEEFTLRYLSELIPAQIGLATPPVFTLGVLGLVAMLQGRGGTPAGRMLLSTMVGVIAVYFLWHSLHDRVQGNWLAPIYPAFSIAAAAAADAIKWRGFLARLVEFSRRWALVTGIVFIVLVGLQGSTGIFPLGPRDPTGDKLGGGWRELAAEIEAERARLGATAIITTNYAVTAWIAYYSRQAAPVVQINDRIRWVNMSAPDPGLFGRVLYVSGPRADRARVDRVRARYRKVEEIAERPRIRRSVVIETYKLYLAEGLTGESLDPVSPAP